MDLYDLVLHIGEALKEPDFLFRNDGTRFTGVITQLIVKCGTTHDIQSGWTSTKTATWIFRSPTTIRAAGQGRLGA